MRASLRISVQRVALGGKGGCDVRMGPLDLYTQTSAQIVNNDTRIDKPVVTSQICSHAHDRCAYSWQLLGPHAISSGLARACLHTHRYTDTQSDGHTSCM